MGKRSMMLALSVLLMLTAAGLRSTTGTKAEGFMAFGTTLSENAYEISYEIRCKKRDGEEEEQQQQEERYASSSIESYTYIEEKLPVRLLRAKGKPEPIRSLPSPHALVSRFGTAHEVKLLVLKKLLGGIHNTNPRQDPRRQNLQIVHFSTADLLANNNQKEDVRVHSSFWLVDPTGIHCFQFNKDGELVGLRVTMDTFNEHLTADKDSPTNLFDVEERIGEIMKGISEEWAKKETAGAVASKISGQFTAFGTTLQEEVCYKRVAEEPVLKNTKRRSFTGDYLAVFRLTKTSAAAGSIPAFHPLVSHIGTTVETTFYVRNVPMVENQSKLKKASSSYLSATGLTSKEQQETTQVEKVQASHQSDDYSSPKILSPQLDILPPFGNAPRHMYSYSTFDMLVQNAQNCGFDLKPDNATVKSSFWLLDGKGVHCFRFNKAGIFVGDMVTVATWANPLPTNPESPTQHGEIKDLIAKLMVEIRKKMMEQEREELGFGR